MDSTAVDLLVEAAPAEDVVDVITVDNSADYDSNRAMGFAALAVAAAAFIGVKAFIRKREKGNI